MEGMEKFSPLPEEEEKIRQDAWFLGLDPDEAVRRHREKMLQATNRLRENRSEKAVEESAKEIVEIIEKAKLPPKESK